MSFRLGISAERLTAKILIGSSAPTNLSIVADPKLSKKKGTSRYYELAGEEFVSVTTIISGGMPKPAIPRWAAKVSAQYAVDNWDSLTSTSEEHRVNVIKAAPWRELSAKADLGTLIHDAIDAHHRGDDSWEHELDKDAVGFVYGALAFDDHFEPEILAVEATVFNRKYGYAGTLDRLERINDALVIHDWKSSKAAYPDHGLQIAAYANAEFMMVGDEEVLMKKPEYGIVVTLDAEGGYVATPFRDLNHLFSAFLHAKGIYDWSRAYRMEVPLKP
jgi:hypothetical protein